MKIIRFVAEIVNKTWPLLVATLLLVVARHYLLGYVFPGDDKPFNYRFLIDSQRIPYVACGALLVAFPVITLWLGEHSGSGDRQREIIGLVSFITLMLTTVLSCFSYLALSFSDFGHYDEARLNEQAYYLDSIWKEGGGDASASLFALFECDNSGVMCQMVFSKLYHPNEEEFEAMTGQLVVDEALDSITVHIESEDVYIHLQKR
jgi:hypothetical protein